MLEPRRTRFGLLSVVLVATACGGAPPPRPAIALVRHTTRDGAALDLAIRDAGARLPVTLEPREVPAAAVTAPARTTVDFARVRTAYDDGDLEACLAGLPDAAATLDALARGDTLDASRQLFWRMACLRALGRSDEALAVAREHATRHLPLPPDLGAANATAETLLRDAHRAASAEPTVRMRVTSEPPGAAIAIDGTPTAETTPADVALVPGAHLVTLSLAAHASRSDEVVAAADAPPVSLSLAPLEPDAAAAALAERIRSGAPADADLSLVLLRTALRSRSVLLVTEETERAQAALIGTADAGGQDTIVRGERVGDATRDLEGLLRDVLVRARLVAPPPPFYELPELWISVAAAIAIGVGVTLGVTLQPEPQTRVVLGP